MNIWNTFAAKHPAAAKWVREGGLFVIVSTLSLCSNTCCCNFCPKSLRVCRWWTLDGRALTSPCLARPSNGTSWAMTQPMAGCPTSVPTWWRWCWARSINFPIQRSFVFRSKGNLAKQIRLVCAGVLHHHLHRQLHQLYLGGGGRDVCPDFIYNIGTTVLNGGISMVIFFFVNKIIFPEGAAK